VVRDDQPPDASSNAEQQQCVERPALQDRADFVAAAHRDLVEAAGAARSKHGALTQDRRCCGFQVDRADDP